MAQSDNIFCVAHYISGTIYDMIFIYSKRIIFPDIRKKLSKMKKNLFVALHMSEAVHHVNFITHV